MQNLDSDLLRTFLAITDAGSFVGGAERIHRSQSAASIQIRKLEDLLGGAVFSRHGRGVELTAIGEQLEPVARDVVGTLDRALSVVTGRGLEGQLRVGIPDDGDDHRLAAIVADFARTHPRVELRVRCSLSAGFSKALVSGELDLAVHEVETPRSGMVLLRAQPISWAASRGHEVWTRDPLPVALFDRECWWRDATMVSLQQSGRRFEVVYSSETSAGIAAAIRAGIAVGVLNRSSIGGGLRPLSVDEGFPDLPPCYLVAESCKTADPELCAVMTEGLRRAFAAE